MQITVQLTKAELQEIEATQEQIRKGIVQLLDGGIEFEDVGKVYFAELSVDVEVVNGKSDMAQRGGFTVRPDTEEL